VILFIKYQFVNLVRQGNDNHNYKYWQEKLPGDILQKLGKGKLSNFPHFATFLENHPKFIDLEPIQANLLSHMSCSVVRDNIDIFSKIIT
jgi:hypothetical protein